MIFFTFLYFVAELDIPSKWLVQKFKRRVFEGIVAFSTNVASFVKYDRDNLKIRIKRFYLNFNVLAL